MATQSIQEFSAPGPGKLYKNFIDGEWVEASSSDTFENLNPADTRDVVGIFQRSTKADVDAAVEAAARAFDKWRLFPAPPPRGDPLRPSAHPLGANDAVAPDLARRDGKILPETRGDVQEA